MTDIDNGAGARRNDSGTAPPWVLGAATADTLRSSARRLRQHVAEAGPDLWDVGRTLTAASPPHGHRAVVWPHGGDVSTALTALEHGRPHAHVLQGAVPEQTHPVFVFPGQGAVFPGMGASLLESSPVFARRINECADALAQHVDWSLLDVLRGEGTAGQDAGPDVVEPVLFAVMVSLAELWQSHGVQPRAVVGFSLGEIAAACVSGALSLEEATRIAVLWSQAHVPLVGQGSMAIIGLAADEVAERFGPSGAGLDIAGRLAPRSVVVAGATSAIDEAIEILRDEGSYAQKLSVDFPAHSPRVRGQRDNLLASLGVVAPAATELPFYSSVTGGLVDTRDLDAEYWYSNLRQPILFEQAAQAVLADGNPALVELSAHPVLVTAMNEIVGGDGTPVIGTLRRDQQGMDRFHASLAEAYVRGVTVDWRPVFEGRGAEVDLPDLDAPGHDELASGGISGAAPGVDTAESVTDSDLVDAVCTHIVGELGLGPVVALPSLAAPPGATALTPDGDASLFDLGFDSIQLVKLQTQLQRRLDVKLESTCIIDHPRIGALVGEIRTTLAGQEAAPPRTAVSPPSPARTSSTEPIAVIGMSFRLPGGIRTRERLWDVLSQQEDVVTDVPADRWPQSPLDLSEVTTTQGGYLPDVDQFDPLFFNISPHEAEQMDPQQRLLLELTWEAFEDAGMDPYTAGENSQIGTFVGVYNNDYRQVGKDLGYSHEAYSYTGNMANAAAGRVSYVYGFRGPSMAIDTACSSSLYALHLGSRELRQGGCDLIVAAGVNLILSPEGHLSWSRLRALSPSGRCRSFDAGADGYIRSEGGAVVVLKRLSDAERDGDNVLAVLSGSAVNHNGHNGGFTVPNGTAQAGVIEEALVEAGLGIDDVAYVEAHGSGTPIGDPQEINALARVFAGRSAPLRVGSVKSNLGHLESAAGMAALCKIVVSLEHSRLPGTLHFRSGNPMVDWASIPIEVVDGETAWEASGGRRRAGISSFGISGTNAHLIVEEHDRPGQTGDPVEVPRPDVDVPRLLPVSAGSDPALRTALENLAEWSSRTPSSLPDIARTLGTRRSLRHREALVCDDVADIPAAVEAAVSSGRPAAAGRGAAGEVFVFSGQGTQYPGMARELYDHAEAFRNELDELDGEFRRAGDIGLLDVMFGDDADAFRSPLYTQPMIFAVELALARYWTTLGVTPGTVIGHSIGEYAAACFAGVMARQDAVDLVMHRARVMEDTPRNGSMATLLCSLDRAEELLRSFPDVGVAAVNAPENVTVSGLTDSIDAALKAARKQRIFTERLDVSHPFHSAQMAQGAEHLHELIRGHRFDAPTIPWISAQTGAPVGPETTIDAAYWSRHLVEPVMFRAAIGSAHDAGMRTFVEIGAMATLGGLIAQEFSDEVLVLPSLRKGRSDVRQVLESAGQLWAHGRDLDFEGLPGTPGRLARDLPHTPWDRQRIWYPDRTGEGGDVMEAHADEAVTTAPDPAAARAPVVEFVKQALNQVTGVAVVDMEESLELFSLGVDSLMLVQLGKRVEKEYDVDIPIRTFFESLHTLGALTDFVLGHRPAEAAAPSAAPAPALTVPVNGAVQAPATTPVPATTPAPADSSAPVSANGVAANLNSGGVGTPTPGVEGVIRSQLALMEQQLQVLAGTADAPAPGAPTVGAAPALDAAPLPAPVPVRAKQQPAKKVGTYSNNIELDDDRLTDEQSRFVRDFVGKYTARTRQSKAYADEHRETLADWIASLNFNPSLKETVYPVVSAGSRGASFWDLDGNEYLDTTMGYGVHFFGHQPDFVVDAMRDQLERGYELGPQNRVAGEVAELVHEMVGAERVAFCNTGTEAVMVSVRLARAVSGRDRIARFTTSFHGAYDAVLAEADGSDTMPMSIGIPQSMVDDTMVLTYGSRESLEQIREHGHELAAVLVEPVQSRNPALQPREFLRELREICTEHGIALIFDEMIVGFRIELGGAQSYFGVESDMSLYGKLVGGGMPIGIIAGKSRYLDAVDGGAWSDVDDSKPAVPTTFFAGTFCKHPLTMAACKAVLTRLKESGAEELPRLNRFTEEFAQRANDYFEAADVPLKVGYFSSLYRYEPMVAADMGGLALTLNLFFKLLTYHGVYVWERRTAFFSFAHTREHQDRILEAIRASVEALRSGGFDFRRAASTASAGPGTAVAPAVDAPGVDEGPLTEGAPASAVSLQEKGVYVLSRMRGGNEAYQILAGLRFDGPLDPASVDQAFAAIAAKHPKLRSRYEIDATEIRVHVEPHVTVESHLFDQLQDSELSTGDIATAMNAPFDLATAPLWRYGIVVDTEGVHHLVFSFHHIIADGASLEIVLDDLAAYLTHGRLTEEAPSAGYEAFVQLKSEVGDWPEYERHRQWWLQQFQTPPELLDVPSDAPYPVVNDFAGHHHYFEFDSDLHEAATAVIRQHKTTPFVFYLSLWSVLLSRVAESADLCIGVPLDQRIFGSFERTIGMFAQSLPLRISPTPDTRVTDLLVQVQDTSLAAIDHSLYAYETLVEELDLTRDYGRNPLFDVNFTFTNARARAHQFGAVTGTTENFGGDRSMVALNLELTERDGALYGDLSVADFYGRGRAAELMEQYQALIAQVVADPDRTIGELPLIDDTARDTQLTWGTGPVLSDLPGLTELFDDAFKKYAQEPAIRFRGEDLTYEHLAQRVDRYAGLLQAQGVGIGNLVGLLLPPSPDLVVAMLAVNRVGGAWLPMDVTNPPARLASMIDIAAPVKVVCSTEWAANLDLGERALTVTEEDLAAAQQPTMAPAETDDLAYTIFTSGSTGAPKGVTVTNGSLANFLCGMPDALGWAENKTVACLTTPSFDIYLLETLLTLAKGGTVVVADETDSRTPASIAEFLAANEVDYLQLTPTRLRLLCTDPESGAAALGSLEKLVVGGEAFPENLLSNLRSHESLEIFNVFGPTETCIWSSVKDLTTDTPVSIGTPIANTNFYVLDDNLQLVPEGTAGNLWIGGLGVSPGYLNRPDLTEDLFRADPFADGRMYLCGDQAYWKDGEVHCLGRTDNQVKVRGYRVELEEIELAMAGHNLVAGAAAIVREISPGNPVIRGFYQVSNGAALRSDDLREYLARRLTDYMVPATLTEVPDIPTTTSGKVDRPALVHVDEGDDDGGDDNDGTRSRVDEQVVAAWKKVLGDVSIGYDDSFFDLGGNSFSLVLLLEELNTAFPDMLDVSDLFANPTIGRLRSHLETEFARRNAGDVGLAAIPVPDTWRAGDGAVAGRVETTLPDRIRDMLNQLRETTGDSDATSHGAFAVTLGKLLNRDEVTLGVVRHAGDIVPVRLGLAGKADLDEIVEDYRSHVDSGGHVVDLRHATLAPPTTGGAVTVACCTSATQADTTELLRHFDIVLALDSRTEQATASIAYARTVDYAQMELLLSSYIKVLGVVGVAEPNASKVED